MERKKIAIVLDSFNIGGIPKVCNLFMNRLIEYYDITLFLKNDDGELAKDIPPSVKKFFISSQSIKSLILNDLRKFKFFSALKFLYKYFRCHKRIVKRDELVSQKRGIITEEKFDAVFAYHGMNLWNLTFSLYRIKAKKRIAWLHGDHPYCGIDKEDIGQVYLKYDKIYCGSKVCVENYINDFPYLKNKLDIFLYPINSAEIILKSKNKLHENFNNSLCNIVTVGRVSSEKGQDLIPAAVAKLVEDNYKIYWYIVGDGQDCERIRELAKKFNVMDYIKFTGSKPNPYPYIKNCDIYVQPSYSECYSLTICEAGILGKAIIATDVCGIKDEISDDTAIFVAPDSNEIANAIKFLIDNNKIKSYMEENIAKIDFSHKEAINKLLKYI